MPTEAAAATALITNDAVVLGLLSVMLGGVFWAARLSGQDGGRTRPPAIFSRHWCNPNSVPA